jgi:hypothetical protein
MHISNGSVDADRFIHDTVDHDVDDRVHLYGGAPPSARLKRHQQMG